MDQKIAADLFLKHHELLVKSLPNDVDAFFILSGKEEGSNKPKTRALYIWLFGYDMIETIFVITRKSLIYLASSKKLQMMNEIKQKLSKQYTLHLIQKQQSNNRNEFESLMKQIKSEFTHPPKVVYFQFSSFQLASLTKEKQSGTLQQEWAEFLGNTQLIDASEFVQLMLSVKDSQEISFITQSSQLACHLLKKLISQIENSIDQSIEVKHSDLTLKIEKLLENPSEKQKIQSSIKLVDGSYDVYFPPIIQSGGVYSFNKTTTNSQLLSTDVILLQVGTVVNEYITICHRTLFIDPTERQKRLYNLLLDVQAKAIASLIPGKKLSEVWAIAKTVWPEDSETEAFPTSLGYGTGLEFPEQILTIKQNNQHEIQDHEVYFVQAFLENVSGGQKGINYTVSIGDIVHVNGQTPQVLTQTVSKAYKNISYQLQDEPESPQIQHQKPQKPEIKLDETTNRGRTRGPRNQQIQIQRQNEKQRQRHQQDLREEKQAELIKRLEKDEFSKEYQQNKPLELDKLNCYKSLDQLPKEAKKGQIYIDPHKAALLLPFQGTHIPVHVSCIKNVSKVDEGKIGPSLRINFFTTETSTGTLQFPTFDGQVILIKELQFRSKTVVRLQELINQIKQLQKRVKAEQQVEREKQNVGEMENLSLNRGGRKPVFKDLKIRPTLASGKGSGQLEVHTNGFRYIYNNKETVDIVFKNIKHYVYQTPEQEIIAALHFNLYNPVIIGKKKTQDIQFYCEVGGGVEHLEGRRKNQNDEDEIEDEERLRQQRKKMAKEFEAFIKSIEECGKDYKIMFEKPYRDLGFEGNWNRARIFFQPTLNTLMSVVETPFFILTISEVEIACFERVMPGIKSFDLVFVFKNYEKPVLRIESIDIKDLEGVKNWLDKMNILFFEVAQNLVWKNVLGTIQKDIAGFVEDGGWGTVLGESDEGSDVGGDEGEEGEDSEFSPGNTGSDDDYSEDIDEDEDFTGDDEDDDDEDDEDLSDVLDLENLSEEDDEEMESSRQRKKPNKQEKQKQVSNKKTNGQQNQQNKRNPTTKQKKK